MPLFKEHEWEYLQSTGDAVFCASSEKNRPYFICLDAHGEEAYVERDVFEKDLNNGIPRIPRYADPSYVGVNPELSKNIITVRDEEVHAGYVLRWKR